jgi:tetratricopeptide (TPR) repeat protein
MSMRYVVYGLAAVVCLLLPLGAFVAATSVSAKNQQLLALSALRPPLSALDTSLSPKNQQLLWEHRNLGKAFFENPDTHVQAVVELKDALDLSGSVRDRVNYGLGLLRAGQTDAGMAQLIQAQKEDPTNPYTWFNLGITYKHAGDYDKAIEQLKGMIKLRPNEAVPHYNLAAVLRAQNNLEAALPEFLEAEKLDPDLAGPHFQLFSTYQRLGRREDALRERQAFEAIKKREEGAAIAEDMESCFYSELYDPADVRTSAADVPTKYDDTTVSTGWDTASTDMALIDARGTGASDLLIWSKDKVELLERGTTLVKPSGLEGLKDVVSIAVGDYDNDGLADICVLTKSGAALYRNNKGVFEKGLDLPNTAGATVAVWLDFDHDYDLDLLLFGPSPVLMRNDGNGKFEDKTSAFPFVKGAALDAVTTAVRVDTAARDVVVTYADRAAVLYRDLLNGQFTAGDLNALPAGARKLAALDFDHDGLIDLVSFSPRKIALHNNQGVFEATDNAPRETARIRADFNRDRREDHAELMPDGSVHLFLNASPDQRWLTVRIIGTKNIKTGIDATVEMKSGGYYEKRIYQGTPLAFAVDGRADVDAIRITWPNGLIQNEAHQKIAALTIPEAQRLSGSCPMIFTWDGGRYRFITDVLGVAPLGASSGDGNYFPVDHDEYIQIPGEALKARNGKYGVHITEELHEVSYLDQVQLIAVDHPQPEKIYTNDKFKSPPYPEFRLFGAAEKLHPVRATDAHGMDATARVTRIDHTYPDAFKHNTSGVAELHTLDLDFGKVAADNQAALVLNGWVDWADGSTFLGASQNGQGLVFPYLQVKDSQGNWKTVVEDMGIPSGKPKTMVVDLTGKFLSPSREVRIVTNLCVYWDEIFLINHAGSPHVKLSRLHASTADVHFRGFSEAVIDPQRQQPEQFIYGQVHSVSSWNPTRGNYTRYGDVGALVQAADDKMVIMGSGDELSLEFPDNLAPPKPGWTRDFLLLVDGWAKDADANTAYSENVLPLPFHAMSAYPYKASEHFPDDAEHTDYVKDFLTRPALRLIRPLAAQR